jgi:hypothetical protein
MTPGTALGWFLQAWVLAVAVLVMYRVVTRQIPLDGLLSTHHGHFSPERAQLFFVTVGALIAYAANALQTKSMGAIPDLATLLAASNAIHLVGKAVRK